MQVEMINGQGHDILDATSTPAADAPAPRPREGESRREFWERCRKAGRSAGMDRRAAYDYATVEADRCFAPGDPSEVDPAPDQTPAATESPPVASSSGLVGLGDLPPSWPSLPANASLQAEVSWVQANRLRVCQDGAVDLARSLSPAPSYAALSWLETSIQFPAKFADVAVKASQDQQDDQQDVRREKVALVEVQGLLAEAASCTT